MLPLVQAQEDPNYLNELDVSIEITSKVKIEHLSPNYQLKHLNTSLYFFPRQDEFQSFLDQHTTSIPSATVTDTDNEINYLWEDEDETEIFYTYNADLNSVLALKKIKNKIPFPIEETLTEYLQTTPYILSDSEEIKKQATKIAEGHDDLYEVVFEVSDWVNENIDYSLETLTAEMVQNADWVLENRRGVCDELTVLFISMLRSLNIPARFVSGTSYTNVIEGFGNHAWAEVYFPTVGWVPFDPTYAQNGYVDATHIKMRDSLFAKESAVNYAWLSKDVEVSADHLNITTEVIRSGTKLQPLVSINVKALNNNVGPGSTIPIEIELDNSNDFYLPVTLYITKAPKTFEDNTRQILLKPFEKKSLFWNIQIPSDTDAGFIYKANVEFLDFFGSVGSSQITYGDQYEVYSEEDANRKLSQLEIAEEKTYNSDVELICESKERYYLYENKGDVSCNIKNRGNTNLKDLEVCLDVNCKKIDLQIQDNKNISFEFNLDLKTKELAIKAENEEISKYAYLPLQILQSPTVQIKNINYPNEIDYNKQDKIKFFLDTDASLKDLRILLNNKEIFNIPLLEKGANFTIPFKGEEFYKKQGKIEFNYLDENNKPYELEEGIPIKVLNPPWYANLFFFLTKLI